MNLSFPVSRRDHWGVVYFVDQVCDELAELAKVSTADISHYSVAMGYGADKREPELDVLYVCARYITRLPTGTESFGPLSVRKAAGLRSLPVTARKSHKPGRRFPRRNLALLVELSVSKSDQLAGKCEPFDALDGEAVGRADVERRCDVQRGIPPRCELQLHLPLAVRQGPGEVLVGCVHDGSGRHGTRSAQVDEVGCALGECG